MSRSAAAADRPCLGGAASEPGRAADWSLALGGAWLATAVILFSSTYLFRLLGRSALIAIERLMGMLLTTIAVELFIKGITQLSR